MYRKWTLNDIEYEIKMLGIRWNYSCNIPIEISKRAKKRMGAFFYREKNKNIEPIKLVFANNLIDGRYEENIVKEVIIHEYIHFYCDTKTGVSNGHNKFFKAMCKANGISSSTTFKYRTYEEEIRKTYKLYCKSCGKLVCIHKRKDAAERKVKMYISLCCNSKLKVEI